MPTINTAKVYTQSDGVAVMNTPSYHEPVNQVSFYSTCTTGTLLVEVKYHPKANWEIQTVAGDVTPLVIDLSAPKTFQLFDKWVYSFRFTPTGADGEYSPMLASGRMYD